jgi:hypothetical protein
MCVPDEALLRYAKISKLSDPDSCNVESLRTWLKAPDCGNHCIAGKGSETWGDLYQDEVEILLSQRIMRFLGNIFWPRKAPDKNLDLVTTRPPKKVDGFANWIAKEWIPLYHACRNSRKNPEPKDLEKSSVRQPISQKEKVQGKQTSRNKSLVRL